MKRQLVFIISVLLTGLVSGVFIVRAVPASKVTICHATSSAENPWVRIVVSDSAIGGHFDNPGSPKAGHEDDILLEGEVDCPVPPVVTPPDVTPTPDTPPVETPTTPQPNQEVSTLETTNQATTDKFCGKGDPALCE